MHKEELQQLKDLLFKFEDWNCNLEDDCSECPMYLKAKNDQWLCSEINITVQKFKE